MAKKSILERHKELNRKHWKNIPDTVKDPRTEFLSWDESKVKDAPIRSSIRYSVIKTTEFRQDYKKQDLYTQELINRLISDLEAGFIYANSPGNYSDVTTYMAYDSNEGRLSYEKRINYSDRLTYYIEKPFYSKSIEAILYKIRLTGCIGHSKKDQFGNVYTYSETEYDEYTGPSLNDLDGISDRNMGELNKNDYLYIS